MKRITYKLDDFPKTSSVVQSVWLLSQVCAMRQTLNKTKERTHDSSFSKWRKMVGSTNKTTMTQYHAAQIVFLAAYSKSGKPIVGKRFLEIKAIAVRSLCSQWLTALNDRFAAGKATDDDREIFKVLGRILSITPTPSQLQAAIQGAKELGEKRVSLRTMQRDARSAKVPLKMSEPIPIPVLRRSIRRLLGS